MVVVEEEKVVVEEEEEGGGERLMGLGGPQALRQCFT